MARKKSLLQKAKDLVTTPPHACKPEFSKFIGDGKIQCCECGQITDAPPDPGTVNISNAGHTLTIVAPRNPAADDQVLISFGDTNQLCEVEHPWLQLHHVSPDGYVAVVVKEYPDKIFPHKSKGEGAPYWEWPA